MLKKYKFALILIFAILLNAYVFMVFLPNAQTKQEEEKNIEQTLMKLEDSINKLNATVENQTQLLENLQMQRAIDNLLLTIE